MSGEKQPAAGWYDDPAMVNTRRYWDGAKWTEHRQEKTASRTPVVTTEKPKSKSWWHRPLTVGGAIALVIIAMWFVVGGGRDLWHDTSVDGTYMEIDINAGLTDQGVKGADVSCPSVDHVEQGDVTICEGTDGAGHDLSVEVTFNSDGSYVYRQQ